MPPKLKFTDGEKVLCFHGPLIYEAKCLKATVTKDKQVKYFVHYAGWSKNWDEWVPEARVLKYNETNVAKQKEVLKNHSAPVKAKKTKAGKAKTDLNVSKDSDSRASTPVLDASLEKKTPKTKQPSTPSSTSIEPSQTPEPVKRKRSKLEITVDDDKEYVSKVEITITMPEELKQVLVDDWEIINKQKKLWSLPAPMTVDEILDNFLIQMKASNKVALTSPDSAITEIANGIREYFNAILSTQLLYKFERPQYLELVEEEEDVQASNVYGGIHLLRLFVRLGRNLAFTLLEDHNISFLVEHLHDFLKYLLNNSGSVFNMQACFVSTQEYAKKIV